MLRFSFIILLLASVSLSAGTGKPQPVYGAGWDLFASPGAIALQNKTVFMTWPSGHNKAKKVFAVIDVTVTDKPRLLGSCPVDGFPQDISITPTHAYVVNGRELLTLDISKPASPKIVSRTMISEDPMRGPQGIDLVGRYAYLACRRDGVKVLDLEKPASPVVVGHIPLPGFSRDVTVGGSRLYVASGTKGMLILDRSDPVKPGKPVRIKAPKGVINRIIATQSTLYLAGGNLPVACVSVADKAWLGGSSERGVLSPFYGAFCFDLVVQSIPDTKAKTERIIAFSADGEGGLIATDVTNPSKLRFAGALMAGVSFGNAHFFTGVSADKTYAYLNDAWYGLRIVKITDPEAMELVGPGIKLNP